MPSLYCLLLVRSTTLDLVSHAGLVDFLMRHCGPVVILLGILRIVGSDVESLRPSDTVRRMFITEPGVINVGPSHGASRRYRVLRIPLGVLNPVMAAREINHAQQAGRTQQ